MLRLAEGVQEWYQGVDHRLESVHFLLDGATESCAGEAQGVPHVSWQARLSDDQLCEASCELYCWLDCEQGC